MARKRHTAEEIVAKLQQVDILSAQGRPIADAIRAVRLSPHRRDAEAGGWSINKKRVERLWRREGFKVPSKQSKRGHLWLNDGSCLFTSSALALLCVLLTPSNVNITSARHHP